MCHPSGSHSRSLAHTSCRHPRLITASQLPTIPQPFQSCTNTAWTSHTTFADQKLALAQRRFSSVICALGLGAFWVPNSIALLSDLWSFHISHPDLMRDGGFHSSPPCRMGHQRGQPSHHSIRCPFPGLLRQQAALPPQGLQKHPLLHGEPQSFPASVGEGEKTGRGRTDAHVEAECSHVLPPSSDVCQSKLTSCSPPPPPPAPVADI